MANLELKEKLVKPTTTKDSGECVLLVGDEAGEAARWRSMGK
jgi:hypothetical protein